MRVVKFGRATRVAGGGGRGAVCFWWLQSEKQGAGQRTGYATLCIKYVHSLENTSPKGYSSYLAGGGLRGGALGARGCSWLIHTPDTLTDLLKFIPRARVTLSRKRWLEITCLFLSTERREGPPLRHQPLCVSTKEEGRLKNVALLLPLLLGKEI